MALEKQILSVKSKSCPLNRLLILEFLVQLIQVKVGELLRELILRLVKLFSLQLRVQTLDHILKGVQLPNLLPLKFVNAEDSVHTSSEL